MRPLSRSFALAFVLGSVTTFILTGVVSTQQAGRQIGDPGGPGTENPNTAYSRNILIGNTLYVAGNTGQVQNTGSIGPFRIMGDRALAAGVRRIVSGASQHRRGGCGGQRSGPAGDPLGTHPRRC